MLGQHLDAMELALSLDIDLAVKCAGGKLLGGPLSEDLSKKLWLRVAKHVVQEKNDIKQVKTDFKKLMNSNAKELCLDNRHSLSPALTLIHITHYISPSSLCFSLYLFLLSNSQSFSMFLLYLSLLSFYSLFL